MTIEALDHLVIAVPRLAAADALEQLGLRVTGPRVHAGLGTEARVVFVGEGDRQVYLEFIALRDRFQAAASGARASLFAALERGGGAYRLAFRTSDLTAARKQLGEHAGEPYRVTRDDGSLVGEVLPVLPSAGLGCDVSLIQYAPDLAERHARRVADGLLAHDLPLRRLDHLAIVAPDGEQAIGAWQRVLGLGVAGEVRGPGIVITQIAAGDVMVELLSPDGPDSPLAGRTPGLASMAAFEVEGLDGIVGDVRARGFELPDARPGPLPGTRVTTVPGAALAGLSLQLLEYVDARQG